MYDSAKSADFRIFQVKKHNGEYPMTSDVSVEWVTRPNARPTHKPPWNLKKQSPSVFIHWKSIKKRWNQIWSANVAIIYAWTKHFQQNLHTYIMHM